MDFLICSIKLFPYGYAPRGWVLCDGGQYPIRQYLAVYSLIGNTFGGDSKNYFNVPNLIGAEPDTGDYCKYYIAMEGLYPVRS